MIQSASSNAEKSFSPVFYVRYAIEGLTREEIDVLLENGWFRNDLFLYYSHCRFVESSWRSSIMLRIPLRQYIWKKRLRKLVRRNNEIFTVKIRPCQVSPEMEELWQLYKSKVHNWMYVPALDYHIFRGVPPSHFHTWELCVYHENRLVAFSIFDKGTRSIASLEAAYHPDYSKYSLGIYTMMLEIDMGIREQFAHYYPGFLPRDVTMFEYKLRPGGVEFFRYGEGEWVRFSELVHTDWVFDQVIEKLKNLSDLIPWSKISMFAIRVTKGNNKPGLYPKDSDFNIFLFWEEVLGHHAGYKVAWEPRDKHYYFFYKAALTSGKNKIMPQKTEFIEDEQAFKFIDKFQKAEELITQILKIRSKHE